MGFCIEQCTATSEGQTSGYSRPLTDQLLQNFGWITQSYLAQIFRYFDNIGERGRKPPLNELKIERLDFPWATTKNTLYQNCCNPLKKKEPAVGVEPTTDGLQNRCSTTELSWLFATFRTAEKENRKVCRCCLVSFYFSLIFSLFRHDWIEDLIPLTSCFTPRFARNPIAISMRQWRWSRPRRLD